MPKVAHLQPFPLSSSAQLAMKVPNGGHTTFKMNMKKDMFSFVSIMVLGQQPSKSTLSRRSYFAPSAGA